ncbi:MAG: ATP-binding protein [Caulobacterales bacterium]|nr:ATP-binding protein [Caulobacterales bacterium]
MDAKLIEYFNALSEKRKNLAEALEDPAARGVKKSVVEKYSDQAHFIYELLQNADDAKATSARFELHDDKLVFIHNGTRHFTISNVDEEGKDQSEWRLGDLNAITSIGNSSKNGEEATIGKFGVGFKAVFQYTNTPYIYAPNIFFKIERFIVPVMVEKDFEGRRTEETLFVFPFNHEERAATEAFEEISYKLKSLDFPLLFLSNLKDISFDISGSFGLYGKEIVKKIDFGETTAELIKIIQNDANIPDELSEEELWMFSRRDECGRRYSVGFFLNSTGSLVGRRLPAFCFFPTKEVTGLNFILHAPFLLTDSREGIRAGVIHNEKMISSLAELAADSFSFLKEIGLQRNTILIDDNILDIIPVNENDFNEVSDRNKISFKPFFTAIRTAFASKAILPSSKGFVEAKNAYWASVPEIANLFSNEQLANITGNQNAKWAFVSLGRNETLRNDKSRAQFVDSITSGWIDEDRMFKGWVIEAGVRCEGISSEFIELQTFEWLHELYKWVDDTNSRTNLFKTKPLLLNEHGKAVLAFDANGENTIFLPYQGCKGLEAVNKRLLENENTLAFIKKIGVSAPSLKDEIYNIILPLYKAEDDIDTVPHFGKFFQFFKDCPNSEVSNYIAMIQDCEFLLYRTETEETQFRGKAHELYLPEGHLKTWFKGKPDTKFLSFDEYLEIVEDDDKDKLIEFLMELGVAKEPRVISRTLTATEAHVIREQWPRSTSSPEWKEKYLDGCRELLQKIVDESNLELSLMLWGQLEKCASRGYDASGLRAILKGKYTYFYYSRQYEFFDSTEMKYLGSLPWVLSSDGEFKVPSALNSETIAPCYEASSPQYSELCNLLGIAELSLNSEVDIESYGQRHGYSNEDLKRLVDEDLARKKSVESFVKDEEVEKKSHGNTEAFTRIARELVVNAHPDAKSILAEPSELNNLSAKVDEDEYTKPAVDLSKKIEQIKNQAEKDIWEIGQLEDLNQAAQSAEKYSYGWFKALLELETITSGEGNANTREISISFSKVELEAGTSRILTLKHPNRYIPQSMEDLADIPLELHFANQPSVKVAVEVINVKSYTLRAKLRTNVQIDGLDLSQVIEAKIQAKNPVFLLEELRKAFINLGDERGFEDDFDMQKSLSENIEFIFGPPGTGKTTHLARDIILPMMCAEDDIKVLVLTPTNKSADVLVRRIIEIMGEDNSYQDWLNRFGATNDSLIEHSGVFRDKTFDIRTLPRNVTVTTIARFPYDYFLPDNSTRLHLSALRWDYIIIDEASMIPLANIIYPLFKKTPQKFIIAGDPFQIEPITSIDAWKNENIYTMVKLNSFTAPSTVPHMYKVELLTTQYRSIPQIGEVFSKFAYGGVLNHSRIEKSQRQLFNRSQLEIRPLNILKFPVSKYESVYKPKKLQSKSNYQVYSALFAFEFIKYLASIIETQQAGEICRIGLIAPYRAQSDLIAKLMSSAEIPVNVNVQVGTIHGFQGDECDIIIALFNPPPSISLSKEMFLNKLNIMNVSISRARDYLFILIPDDETEHVNNLTLVKRIEGLCKEQTDWTEFQCSEIEEIMFGNKAYLEDNSFSTSHQLVNVYGKSETRYEIRSEDNAIDIQIYD